jgi:uncharacterized membrane protein
LVLAAAAVLAGVALRLRSPGSLWLDEAITVDISRLGVPELLDALRRDGHPPLSYLVLHQWMALFGESARSARALSAVISTATLPLAWFAGLRLGGRRTAVLAVLLLATSPYAVRFGTEARMYALLGFLGLAGYLAVVRALERPSTGRVAVVSLLTAATLLTHYWGFWLVAAAFVLLVAAPQPHPAARRAARRVAAGFALGSLALVGWLPSLVQQFTHTGTPWAQPVEPVDAAMDTLLDLGGGKWVGGRLLALIFSLTLVVALFAKRPTTRWELDLDLRTVPGVRRELAVVGLSLALALGATMVTASAFQPRYVAALVPLILLVAAVGLLRIPHPVVRQVVMAAVVLLGLAGSLRTASTPRTQAADIAAAIAATSAPGDVIGYCPDQLRPAVERELDQPVVARTFPDGSPPGRIDWTDYRDRIEASSPHRFAEQLVALAGPGGAVFLVSQDRYRGFEDACGEVQAEIEAVRGPGTTVISADDASYERADLRRYPAP